MDRYLLEIENWIGGYDLEATFPSLLSAKRHGEGLFPQNKWRIRCGEQVVVVYSHDPFGVIAAEAALELDRFRETEHWRRVFADRLAAEIRREQERERLMSRAQERVEVAWARSPAAMDLGWGDWELRRNPLEEKVNWLKEGF